MYFQALYLFQRSGAAITYLWCATIILSQAFRACEPKHYAGVMWNGVPAVKAGSIITGIILGTFVVFEIDRRLDKAGIVAFAAAGLSAFGLMHSALLGFYPTAPFVFA